MKRNEIFKLTLMRGWKLLHYIVSVALFALCWNMWYQEELIIGSATVSLLTVTAAYAVVLILLQRTYNAYRVSLSRARRLVYSLSLSQLISAGVVYVLGCINALRFINPLPLAVMLVAQVCANVIWSVVARNMYFALNPTNPTALIYRTEYDRERLEQVYRFTNKYKVVAELTADQPVDTLIEKISGCSAVFAAGLDSETRNKIAAYCVRSRIDGYFVPCVGDILMMSSEHIEMFSTPTVRVIHSRNNVEYMLLKRAFDIVCSLVGIIIASPFMIATALAVKLYDGGPALYKQVRLTRNGRRFNILKFRSMRTDAEKDGVARLATDNDDRITPVGKFIRACRLDELPQLFNILRGDMTIVGPRPERPEIAEEYEREIPEFSLRLQVKAGLTGLAQVYGKYNTNPYDKLQMDLMYIHSMSVAEDLKLMFATVKVLFMKESTEGVDDSQVTASKGITSDEELTDIMV